MKSSKKLDSYHLEQKIKHGHCYMEYLMGLDLRRFMQLFFSCRWPIILFVSLQPQSFRTFLVVCSLRPNSLSSRYVDYKFNGMYSTHFYHISYFMFNNYRYLITYIVRPMFCCDNWHFISNATTVSLWIR